MLDFNQHQQLKNGPVGGSNLQQQSLSGLKSRPGVIQPKLLHCKVLNRFDLFAVGLSHSFPAAQCSQRSVRSRISKDSSSTQSSERTLQDASEAPKMSQVSLTTFNESANNVLIEQSGKDILASISNPFPDQTPLKLLERTYQVAQFDWTPSFTFNYTNFPAALLTQPTIANALACFSYFRADLEIQIKMNSTPYHQGSLIVAFQPCSDISGYDVATMSGSHPVILSASVQDSCVIKVPYVNPLAWIPLNNVSPYDICSLLIKPLNPLLTTTIGIPASIPITVYAAFKNPKVAGYIQPGFARAQASSGHTRFATGEVADKDGNIVSDDEMTRFSHKVVPEASQKDKNGTDSGFKISPLSRIIRSIPFVGQVYGVVADVFNMVERKDWDKPTSNQVLTVQSIYPYRDQNRMSGSFVGETMSQFPNPYIAPESFAMETSDLSVSTIANIPMLHCKFTFSAIDQRQAIGVTPQTPSQNLASVQVDYLCFIAAGFSNWRGSIKYMFHFVSSAFYSCRFRISYATANPTNVTGDLPQMIVDVKGDCFAELTVPYLYPTYWREVGVPAVGDPKIYIEQLTDIAGSSQPSVPVIYCNVWRSGGEDIQFSDPVAALTLPGDGAFTRSPKVKAVAQSSPQSRFRSKFPFLVDGARMSTEMGICMAEVGTSVKDMIRRYSDYGSINPYTNDFTQPGTLRINIAEAREGFPYFSQIFLFWRGSRRFRVFDNNSVTEFVVSNQGSLPTSYSGIISSPNNQGPTFATGSLDVEIPFMSLVPYSYILRNPAAAFPITQIFPLPKGAFMFTGATSPLTPELQWSAGDDFQYLCLIPPIVALFPPASKNLPTKKPK
jgi:hypothetical protein